MYDFDHRGIRPMKRSFIWAMLFITAMILLFASTIARSEVADNKIHTQAGQLWGCHVPQLDAAVLDRETVNRRGRQFLYIRLDRNMDKSVDMIAVFAAVGATFSPFPIYYIYDTDFDGKPDKAYSDEMGNGICGQMREIDWHTIVDDSPPPSPDTHEDGGQCEMNDPNNPKKEL